MVDTYLTAANEAAFRAFLSFFSQVIGPQGGRAAMPEGVDEDGNPVPAQPAVGDPAHWYACVRANEAVTPPEGVTIVAAEEGEAVLGKWA